MRATAATGSNAHSSRSHAVCRIYVAAGASGGDAGGGEAAEAVLQLVELAGAEDAGDSAARRESAQINTSLAMLQADTHTQSLH